MSEFVIQSAIDKSRCNSHCSWEWGSKNARESTTAKVQLSTTLYISHLTYNSFFGGGSMTAIVKPKPHFKKCFFILELGLILFLFKLLFKLILELVSYRGTDKFRSDGGAFIIQNLTGVHTMNLDAGGTVSRGCL